MADMHLQANSFCNTAIKSFISQLTSFLTVHPGKKPDFIAIAGDLVVGKDIEPDKYKTTQDIVNTLLKEFGLGEERLITVPGNHDKTVPDSHITPDFWTTDSTKLYLSNFSKAYISTKDAEDFPKLFSHFKRFADFYTPYVKVDKENYKYLYDTDLFEKDYNGSGLTSGMKVFTEDKICFLCINSEWTYYPKEETQGKQVRIFAPAVQYSLNQIARYYSDYLVVTLIHRNPATFSWPERNISVEGDILQRIYQYSDVILTGHDHNYQLFPPDYMANSAQLLRLGSISRSDHDDEFVPYNAAILQLDPHKRTMDVLNCSFKGFREGGWSFTQLGKYPIKSLIPSCTMDFPYLKEHTIWVNSLQEEHIKEAITVARRLPDSFHLIVVSASSKCEVNAIKKDIDNNLKADIQSYLVVYCIDDAFILAGKKLLESLHVLYRDEIYKSQLVTEIVSLVYPAITTR